MKSSLSNLQNLIKSKPYLVWNTKDYGMLDEEAIAEAILNYGSWEDVKTYHNIVGLPRAKEIFDALTTKKRSNIKPRVYRYFSLYYKKHASRHS